MAQSTPAFATLMAVLLLSAGARAQGDHSIASSRIFDALALREGATACEMGAGDGELSIAAAARVGRQGHVYTSELGDDRIRTLRTKVTAADRPQIQVVAGAADHTNFPAAACDALFMRNVYHHFAAPGPMGASLAASLKPGGRIAVIDFTPPGAEAPTPPDRDEDNMHGVTPESVRRELVDAGFMVERTEKGANRSFMVVAVRPGS
jgi:ubiquinone/menaquinone biosynthesis C-methylase UbiE